MVKTALYAFGGLLIARAILVIGVGFIDLMDIIAKQ